MVNNEAVRLVIWDLDDTFWHGTLTEGGIREYSQRNHDIVIELASRGIVSSICSKNNPSTVLRVLEEHGILEYFVFPSISWDPKGARLIQMVDTFQLRAPTVMFIDDNPNNRAEAKAMLPDLQVEDENFIPRMLEDGRFKGKADHDLSRLKQYKLLEKRKGAQQSASGTNEEFLKTCDIRVSIDFDVEKSLDRAIELINRTNQLNFTKQRLPEDIDLARKQLSEELRLFDRQAGLVHVVDNYGDYGDVGFFMISSVSRKAGSDQASTTLRHFCFSCRTLGMLVEQWVYNYLSRPKLNVIGDVLTDLTIERDIDWIRQVDPADMSGTAHASIAPLIFMLGGCEAQAIGVYLRAYTDDLRIVGNYASTGTFVRLNGALLAKQTCCRKPSQSLNAEVKMLGLEAPMHACNVFENSPDGALYIFNLGLDYHDPRHYIRHKGEGWRFAIEPEGLPLVNFHSVELEDLTSQLDANPGRYPQPLRDHILQLSKYIKDNYELEPRPAMDERVRQVRELVERLPAGSRCIIIVDHDKQRRPDGVVVHHRWISDYRASMNDIASDYPFVGIVSMSDVVTADTDMTGANHYTRAVYHRCATKVIDLATHLPPRAKDQPQERGLLSAIRAWFSVAPSRRHHEDAAVRR